MFMPQFDFYSFFVQIFWLSVASFTFYLFYVRYPLVKLSQAIKMRKKLKGLSSQN